MHFFLNKWAKPVLDAGSLSTGTRNLSAFIVQD
jgi:hypothetical protein